MQAGQLAFADARPWSPGESILLESQDVDEATAGVGRVFHPHRLTRVESVPRFHADLEAVTVGPLVMGHLRYNSSSDLYCPEIRGYHVNVPLAGRLTSASDGRSTSLGARSGVLYREGADATLLTPPESKLNVFAMKIDQVALHTVLEELIDQPVTRPVDLSGPVDLSTRDGRAWWTLLWTTFRSLESGSMLKSPMLAKPLAYSIILGLLSLTDNGYAEQLRAPARRADPISLAAAVDYIEGHLLEPLTPMDVARAVGISVRGLQRAFREHYGMTPSEYVRSRRMNHAHRELAAARPEEVCIVAVASRWGFHNAGRFAQEYRRSYGVRPSDTLRAR